MNRPFQYVDQAASWRALVATLERVDAFALDIESNGFFAYRERVCLIQLSTRDRDFVVDPFAQDVDVHDLGGVLAEPRIRTVLHGGEYDVLSLRRDYGFSFAGLFDTQLAARALGWPKTGLAAILDQRFGVASDKRYQRYDWGHRPLSTLAIEYAKTDTAWLLELAEQLEHELHEAQRTDFVAHACRRLERLAPAVVRSAQERALSAIPRELDAGAQRRWLALYLLRDEVAAATDRAPFRAIPDSTLRAIAAKPPACASDLAKVRGLSGSVRRRYGTRVLEAVADPPELPPKNKETEQARVLRKRRETLRKWRRKAAAALAIEPEFVMGRAEIEQLADTWPRERAQFEAQLDAWTLERFGDGLWAIISR